MNVEIKFTIRYRRLQEDANLKLKLAARRGSLVITQFFFAMELVGGARIKSSGGCGNHEIWANSLRKFIVSTEAQMLATKTALLSVF